MWPVVESSPPNSCIIDAKAGRSHNPQLGVYGNACSSDVAGVLRDLRLVQDDVRGERRLGIRIYLFRTIRVRSGLRATGPA